MLSVLQREPLGRVVESRQDLVEPDHRLRLAVLATGSRPRSRRWQRHRICTVDHPRRPAVPRLEFRCAVTNVVGQAVEEVAGLTIWESAEMRR